MPEPIFAQTLIETTDFQEGLLLLVKRLEEVVPFQHLSVYIFPKDGSAAHCHAIKPGQAPRESVLDTSQVSTLVGWLRDHPQPYLVPSHNAVFVPTPLKSVVRAEYPYHIMKPTMLGQEVLGFWLLAIPSSEHWKAPKTTILKEIRAIWALWLNDRLAHTQPENQLAREVSYLRDEIKTERGLRSLSGDSAAMKAVRRAIQQVAKTDSTVLIQGETGTGKELVARAIHQLSARRERLQVAVNCAALAPSVIASELFGHEAGAFTGATKRRIGRFELAHQGTLFLDEIADISAEVQAMLLRALQERTIERVGGNTPIPVDVRLVAAANYDLAEAVADRIFRADLYYRLNVFPIRIPPLRERRDDIPDLARHFVLHFNRRMNKNVERIAPQALDRLINYDWPGNVRELENLIERAMILADTSVLDIDANWRTPVAASKPDPPTALRERERKDILDAIAKCHGRIYGTQGAAALLGVKPTTLYGKMRKLGINKNDVVA